MASFYDHFRNADFCIGILIYGCKSPAVPRQDARRAQRHVPLASLFISETSDWPSIESSHALSNKDGGRGRNRLLWYEGGKLRAIHQWLYVLALKAHFPESLLMVVTSVNGWTLPASRHRRLWNTASVCIHSAGASLYCLIAFCQRGYSCRAKGFSHVSRWNDSEPSIVCPSRADLLQAWKQWKKKEHPLSCTLSTIPSQTDILCIRIDL